MMCSLYRLTEEQTQSLLSFPETVCDLLGNSTPPPKPSFLSKFFVRSLHEKHQQRRKVDQIAEGETFELNQAWHILHYLFSGSDSESDWPSTFIMAGGQELGPDLGYGPARLLSTRLTENVADFLTAQSLQTLDAAYVAHDIEVAKIYWQVSSVLADRQRQIEELFSLVQDMRGFFQKTVHMQGSTLVQIF